MSWPCSYRSRRNCPESRSRFHCFLRTFQTRKIPCGYGRSGRKGKITFSVPLRSENIRQILCCIYHIEIRISALYLSSNIITTHFTAKTQRTQRLKKLKEKLGRLWKRLLSSPLERGAGGCVAENLHTPLYRSTDPSMNSGYSAVHGESIEPSRRSPLFLEGNHKRLKFLYLKL